MFRNLLPYYVYILECSDETYYTGITWNLRLRIMRHNGLMWGGGKYTRSRRPVFLVYFEKCDSKSGALKREYEIKSLSRGQKKELVSMMSKEDLISAI
jgi:putative endonuclease